MILIRISITTYEYVVAMRTLSEPGPSVDGGEQESLPSSPTVSAVTAISGRSSVGMSLQYKGAWCTPPRIFMDHDQDEIIPRLEPGRLPSTVDLDMIQPPDKEKKSIQRPVRINAWKLAKLDSNEAAKAAAKARASSSVLRLISSRPYPHDADHLSGGNVSGSSPVSNRGLGKAEASRSSPTKSSYPPSQASKEDSISTLSSPQHSNLAISPMMQQERSSNRDHFNPMYEQEREVNNVHPTHVALRNNILAMAKGRRSLVFWDQEAG
ncbi:hypothetical protein K1719_044625 [Acacia pycnantha]|nr:hypothetical protein K1719_044625 [Acacia pycnantha]